MQQSGSKKQLTLSLPPLRTLSRCDNRTPQSMTRGTSDILKALNFHMNPSLHKRKQVKPQASQAKKVSKVTRNILELRRRKQLKNISLEMGPRIKACRTVVGGTLSVLKNNEQIRAHLHKKYQDVIYTGNQDYNEKLRWLIDNKKDIIYVLNEHKDSILEWVQSVDQVSREEFDIIANEIGLRKDPNLLNRLFWVFDLNDDGQIEFNEMQYSINLFREYDLNDRVQIFFELCDENEDGYINDEDLKKFFNRNLTNAEEIRTMRFVVKDFYYELNPMSNKGLTRQELYTATISDPNVRVIVEKNTQVLKQASRKDEDSNSAQGINNLIYSGYEGKQGVFYPQMDGIVNAFAEKECMMFTHKILKLDSLLEEESD